MIVFLASAGCAVRDYGPSFLPTFMHEETPAGGAGPVGEHMTCCSPGSSPVGEAGASSSSQLVKAAPPEKTLPGGTTRAIEETLPSPRSVRPSGVTIEQAIIENLQADPKLRAGLEVISQANADLLTSSLPPNPTQTINGVFLPLRPFTPERPGGPQELDVIAGFPIDWFLFGKRTAAIANAQLGVEVSAADYADLVRQRVAATIAAFYDVLEARALLDLAREDLASLRRVEIITRQRVKLGGVGTIEQERIRLSVLDSEREVRSRESALVTAKAKLRALLGRSDAGPGFDVAGSLDVPAPAEPLKVEEALAVAEQNRPDIESLRRQITKADAGVRVEQTKAYPLITPSAGLTRQFQHDLGVPDAPSYSLSVVVALPLFDRNQGNIGKAESVLVQSGFNLETQLFQLRADVEQAVEEFRAARVGVTSIGPEQLKAARSVRDRTEAAYKAGGRTLLELIDAQRAYRDTYRSYILGQSTYWHSLHRLNAAIGKQVLR
jgi:outer membrane protein, heavy metal efflux system